MEWETGVNGRLFTTLDAVRLFWSTVRRDIGYRSVLAVADRPRFTAQAILEKLTENKRWLYNPQFETNWERGFDFLDPDEHRRLKEAVEKVRAVVSEIAPGGEASAQQRDRARPDFAVIVGLMAFDRFGDADAFYLGKMIERRLEHKPPHLDHLRFETGADSTGDPALWVWVFVSDSGEYDEARFLEMSNVIEDLLQPIVHDVARNRWPFLRFRSTLDQPEVEGISA
jgi:hypothetical protein